MPSVMWQGKYPAVDPDHAADLQMRSDIYEHMHRMPRAEAEAAAHRDYRKDQIIEAAAHHHAGMKAAAAAGNDESAKKHGVMYALAMHQLGHKDLVNPPEEVLAHGKNTPSKDIASFKAHKGDMFTMPPEEDRASAKEKLSKAEGESEKCSACGGPFHPATGHYHQEDVRVCGPCMRHFVTWFKGHSKGKYGHPKASFYEAAATSIKPGDGEKLGKAETKEFKLPVDHKVGMRVTKGGSMCANCAHVSEDLKKCSDPTFQGWNGSDVLPAPADEYCCDVWEPKEG